MLHNFSEFQYYIKYINYNCHVFLNPRSVDMSSLIFITPRYLSYSDCHRERDRRERSEGERGAREGERVSE